MRISLFINRNINTTMDFCYNLNVTSSNLRRSCLRFSTRPNEWGTQWDLNVTSTWIDTLCVCVCVYVCWLHFSHFISLIENLRQHLWYYICNLLVSCKVKDVYLQFVWKVSECIYTMRLKRRLRNPWTIFRILRINPNLCLKDGNCMCVELWTYIQVENIDIR